MFNNEIKQLLRLGTGFTVLYLLFHYSKLIMENVFSEKGGIWAVISMLSIVLALAIKIYYRIMVIKYQEKNIHIRLFENL
jgi:hypothetical protein